MGMDDCGIDEYREAVRTQDTHKRLKLAEQILTYLKDPSSNVEYADQLADNLLPWAGSSNFKVCIYVEVAKNNNIGIFNNQLIHFKAG